MNTHVLIHPGDAAISDTEWRVWLAGHDFGPLAVNDPGNGAPLVGELLKSVNTGAVSHGQSPATPLQGAGPRFAGSLKIRPRRLEPWPTRQ